MFRKYALEIEGDGENSVVEKKNKFQPLSLLDSIGGEASSSGEAEVFKNESLPKRGETVKK